MRLRSPVTRAKGLPLVAVFDDQKDEAVDAPELLARQVEAGQRARDWVLKSRQSADWVAVVSYDKRLKVQQDFTRDGRALAEAVGDAIKGKAETTPNIWSYNKSIHDGSKYVIVDTMIGKYRQEGFGLQDA